MSAGPGGPPPPAAVMQMMMGAWTALYERAGLRVASITVVNARSGESLVERVAA